MSKYASKSFWFDTLDRVIATIAQAAVATLTADATGLIGLDFVQVMSVAGLAGLVALLTSIAFRGKDEAEPLAPTTPEMFDPIYVGKHGVVESTAAVDVEDTETDVEVPETVELGELDTSKN